MAMKRCKPEAPKEALENEVVELADDQMEKVSGGTGEQESQGKEGDIVLPEI